MKILVATITPHQPPSALSPAARQVFGDRFVEVAALMVCELDKGEPWTGPREVWIEVPE